MEDDQSPMIPTDASYYYYVGRALPQGSDVSLRNLDLNDFTPEQTKNINLNGLRHCRKHNDKKEIGRILEAPSHDKEKFAIGRINVNDPIGKLTVMDILKGKTSDLSLTHNYGLLTYPGMYVEIKEPTEISSVEKGNRPGCRILWGVFDTDLKKQRNSKKHNTMTTPVPLNGGAPPPTTSVPPLNGGAAPPPNIPAHVAPPLNGGIPLPTSSSSSLPVTQQPPPPVSTSTGAVPVPTNTSNPLPPATQNPPPPGTVPADSSNLFAPENFTGLTDEQKTELLIEFSKNNDAMKREMTNLELHKKTLEEEKSKQFEEHKKSLIDLIRDSGGQVESLESELNTFSPTGRSFDEQNKMRGTLVAVKNSVEEMALVNKTLREENERLKTQSLIGKTNSDAQDRFGMMMAHMRNSAPHPARFEPTSQEDQSEKSSESAVPKKRKVEEESSNSGFAPPEIDQGMRMFTNMRSVLTQGTGHQSPWF